MKLLACSLVLASCLPDHRAEWNREIQAEAKKKDAERQALIDKCNAGSLATCRSIPIGGDRSSDHCRSTMQFLRAACDRWTDEPDAQSFCYFGADYCGVDEQTVAYWVKGCDRPQGKAIFTCALAAENTADPDEKLRLRERGCASGELVNCREAGKLREARGDVVAAQAEYHRGCTHDDDSACVAAAELAMARCDRHDEDGCRVLATYLKGSDPIRAVGTLEASCKRGATDSCELLRDWKGD